MNKNWFRRSFTNNGYSAVEAMSPCSPAAHQQVGPLQKSDQSNQELQETTHQAASNTDEVEATALGSAVGKQAWLALAFILIICFTGAYFQSSPKSKPNIPSTTTKSLLGVTVNTSTNFLKIIYHSPQQ